MRISNRNPQSEFAEAKRFLFALNPTGPRTLIAIRPINVIGARRTEMLFGTTIDQAVAFIAEHNDKLNIHLTANTTDPVSDNPRLKNLNRLIVNQVDVDKDATGVRLTAETKQEVVKRMQSVEFCAAASIPDPPRFITDSGHGVQAFWRIRGSHAGPIIFAEPDDDCKFMGIAEPQGYSRHHKC